jgi:large subunit ribosomal protein L20
MRVKRGPAHIKRRKNLLARTKGFRWKRKSSIRLGRQAAIRAGRHAYQDRRLRKRDFRALWQIRINAGVRPHDLSYSQFMHKLKMAKVELDRKVLSDLAANQPDVFAAIVKLVA